MKYVEFEYKQHIKYKYIEHRHKILNTCKNKN